MSLPEPNQQIIQKSVRLMIEGLGLDPDSEAFQKTPHRVAKLYSDVLDGQFAELDNMTSFAEGVFQGAVSTHHVPFYSWCAHHLLPFYGHFGIAYVPSDRNMGLSKLVRIFRHHAKVPTTQEELTQGAVDTMMEVSQAKGAIVYVTAEHMCMSLRGVKSPGAMTTTVAYRGEFDHDIEMRNRFVQEASK